MHSRLIRYSVLGASVLIWVWLFRDFFLGRADLFHDAARYAQLTQEYLDHIKRGVYPLWNPFLNWGHSQTIRWRFFGEFNGLWWFIPLWQKLGMNFFQAYMFTVGAYYLGGLAAFYKLAADLLKSRTLAVLGFVLLLYSPLSYTLLNDTAVPLLFVPSAWFAYWMMRFLRNADRLSFWGIVFSQMVILITYLPFYFITIFILALLFGAALFFRAAKPSLRRVWDYLRRHVAESVFAAVLILISAAPGVIWLWQADLNDTYISYRQSGSEEGAAPAEMHIDRITVGSIAHHFRWDNILFWEDPEPFSLPVHMMLPVSLVFLLMLVAGTRYARSTVMAVAVFMMLVYIALTDATPILEFLYHHVFYFKMVRNLYYLYYMAFPFLILAGLEQLRIWLLHGRSGFKGKAAAMAGAFGCLLLYSLAPIWLDVELPIVHIGTIVFGCAAVWWAVRLSGFRREQVVVCALAVMTMFSGALMVQRTMSVSPLPPMLERYQRSYRPEFMYLRPAKGQVPDGVNMQDTSGLVEQGQKYWGNQNSHWLHKNIPHDILGPYVRHKFVVYDNVHVWGDEENRAADLTAVLENNLNVAFVEELPSGYTHKAVAPRHAERVHGPSGSLWVEHFDLNRIRFGTNYPDAKFVVYNDNMYQDWRVFIDGKKGQLIEANGSFKGVMVPPGKHVIEMRYGRTWIHIFYRVLHLVFICVPLWLAYLYIPRRRGTEEAYA